MLCHNCRKELPDNALFCMHCGTKQKKKTICAKCGIALPETAAFCYMCGKRIPGKGTEKKPVTPKKFDPILLNDNYPVIPAAQEMPNIPEMPLSPALPAEESGSPQEQPLKPRKKKIKKPDELTGQNLTYEINEDGSIRIYKYKGSLTDVSLPASINGRAVTGIGEFAFSECSALTSVTIPESVTDIGESAFVGCSTLSEIHTNAANPAFTSLDGVLFTKDTKVLVCCPAGRVKGGCPLPEGITEIGGFAFFRCTRLTGLYLPHSVTSIGEHAFSGCTGLRIADIPKSAAYIGNFAFDGCTGLKRVIIPMDVREIGVSAFSRCISLEEVVLPPGLSTIGAETFKDCAALTTVRLPEGLTEIGVSAFKGCRSLTNIIIPDSVRIIRENAFSGCTGLINVVLPKSLESIEGGEFGGVFGGCTSLTHIVIPESVRKIQENAFSGCTALKSVTIPGNVETIGKNAFSGCTALSEAVIKNGVKNIAVDTFNDCPSLSIIKIPESVVSYPARFIDTSEKKAKTLTRVERSKFKFPNGIPHLRGGVSSLAGDIKTLAEFGITARFKSAHTYIGTEIKPLYDPSSDTSHFIGEYREKIESKENAWKELYFRPPEISLWETGTNRIILNVSAFTLTPDGICFSVGSTIYFKDRNNSTERIIPYRPSGSVDLRIISMNWFSSGGREGLALLVNKSYSYNYLFEREFGLWGCDIFSVTVETGLVLIDFNGKVIPLDTGYGYSAENFGYIDRIELGLPLNEAIHYHIPHKDNEKQGQAGAYPYDEEMLMTHDEQRELGMGS